MSLASDLESDGTPPLEGTVIPVEVVAFVRILPNLSYRFFAEEEYMFEAPMP